MKKLIRQTTLSAALAMAAVGAWAQQNTSPVYGEIGWTQINYKEAGYSLKPGMVRAMVGIEVHPNLAIEGMLGLGISDDIINIRGVSVTGGLFYFQRRKVVLRDLAKSGESLFRGCCTPVWAIRQWVWTQDEDMLVGLPRQGHVVRCSPCQRR